MTLTRDEETVLRWFAAGAVRNQRAMRLLMSKGLLDSDGSITPAGQEALTKTRDLPQRILGAMLTAETLLEGELHALQRKKGEAKAKAVAQNCLWVFRKALKEAEHEAMSPSK